MSDKKYSLEEIGELAEALNLTQKNDPASSTPGAAVLHGPHHNDETQFGIFSTAGVRPQRWSTLVRPRSLARLLGINASVYHQELLEIMTGVTDPAYTNASDFCGDPPTVGAGKVCQQIYNWGEYFVKTDLNALPKIGALRNRADVPAQILNQGPAAHPLVPDLMFRMQDTRSQLQYGLYLVGVGLERALEHVLVQGDTTLASGDTERGWISEFSGLDNQIKTGYTDAETGIACPAADSMVLSFNAEVDNTDTYGRNLVQAFGDLFFAAQDRAIEMGMDETVFAFVMRKECFRSIVEVYSRAYYSYLNNTSIPENLNTDARTASELRIAMKNGQFLLVEGQEVPVIFSEGITREGLGDHMFKSDVYLTPVSWMGIPLLNLQYFPMDNAYIQEFASLVGDGKIATLNNGLFIAGTRDTGLCLEYLFAAKMRLILETPFLAGRIDDVQYTFRAPIRNSDPNDTYFYADGGDSYRL